MVAITSADLTYAAETINAKPLADYLITKTVHPSGVIALPRCGDGQLAVALGKRTNPPLVYATDARPDQYAAARDVAAKAGVLGSSVYVQQAEATKLPLASNYADLVVLSDLTDADLQPALLAEIQRITIPQTGRAVVGRAKSAEGSGTLTRAALEAWAKAGGKATDVKIVEDAQGLWAEFGRPPIPGADDWTHLFHGPDNNPLSNDTVFDGVPQIAWMAKPYHQVPHGSRLESKGRIFYITGDRSTCNWGDMLTWQIFAYNAFNGRLLWNQPCPKGQRLDSSLAVADGDVLLLAEKSAVRRIDGATGKELGRFTPVGPDAGNVKWMAILNGLLIVHVGPPDPVFEGRIKIDVTLGYGSILIACDPTTGKQIWRYDAPKPLSCQQIAADAEHLYYFVPGAGVTCLNPKTGKTLWNNSSPEIVNLLEKDSKFIRWKERSSLVCTPNAVYAGFFASEGLVALSSKDGKVLWTYPFKKRTPEEVAKDLAAGHNEGTRVVSLFRDNQLIARAGLGNSHTINALTGAPEAEEKFYSLGNGCGAITGSAKYLIAQFGGPVYDFENHQSLPFLPTKTDCAMGQFVAQGQLFSITKDCFCRYVPGVSALTPDTKLEYKRPPNVAEQLVTGAGDIQKVVPLATDANDWTTHRGNINHTGNVPVNAPTSAPKLLWTCTNPNPFPLPKKVPFTEETEHKITEAVTAGGLVFFASSDGHVQCLSAADGKPKWTFWAEAGIFAAPTIAQDRLYIGSADGKVYALEATTGRLLWSFRLSPIDRRVQIFGLLQSPWPVNSGVLVSNGVAYAVAGMCLQPGSYVVALDAITGKPRWQQMNPGSANDVGVDGPKGLQPDGYLALAGGRLWVRSFEGNSGGFCFDAATGKPLPPPISTSGLMGRDIGVLRDHYLLYGGLDIYNSQDYRDYKYGGIGLLELAADGSPQLPDKCIVDPSHLFPVWNQDKIVTVSEPNQAVLECWDANRIIAWTCDPAKRVDLTQAKKKLPPGRSLSFPTKGIELDKKSAQEARLWGPISLCVNSLILTPQAVLLTEGGESKKGGNDQPRKWQLSALSLADGKPLWQIPLPVEPLTSVMSVDRDGRILLGLRNGDVVCYGVK